MQYVMKETSMISDDIDDPNIIRYYLQSTISST